MPNASDGPAGDERGDDVALTVVVPAHDAAATIGEQLDALLAQSWHRQWEVVVVDNRSSDATAAVVERYASRDPRVRLVRAPERASVAYARNVGIAAARGPCVAICDADDVVADGWVRAMGDALEDHDLVTGSIDVHTLNPSWIAQSRGLAIEQGPFVFAGLFPFANGGNMAVRTAVLDRCGGFDPAYVPGEDIELSFRLWQAGIVVHHARDAVLRYRYRPTLRSLWRQARAYARIQPALAELVRRAGHEPDPDAELRRWLWLARHVGLLADRAGRARWVTVAAGRVGRIEGHIDRARARRNGAHAR